MMPPPEIRTDDFTRRFSLRAHNLMWFLGAGASASAGIPTAGDMIWEFKQQLFVSQRRSSPQSVGDLSSPVVRNRLQAHIDSGGALPPAGSVDEYAALFEAVYPSEADRRTYLDSKMLGAKPSYGHMALAAFMRANSAPIVWTTNFDSLVADACAKVCGTTGFLTTVDLDAPGRGRQILADRRFPVEVKLHGDFRSRRLKNTNDELRQQDVELRRLLVSSCSQYGLVVAGYSGRDDSIMDSLEEAVVSGAFPAGLFWLCRGDDAPLDRVCLLLDRAAKAGIEAALVSIANFDEVMRDLVRLVVDVDTGPLDDFETTRRRWTAAPVPIAAKGWPVIRFNALPVEQSPTVCRRVQCSIGGYSAVREAVEQAGLPILFARTSAGVLCFGSDSNVRGIFGSYGIDEFGLHTIEPHRLRRDSGERGLLSDALAQAIGRERGMIVTHRRSTHLLSPTDTTATTWSPLASIVGALSGKIRECTELEWREGLLVQLDWANDGLWLVFEPRIVFSGINVTNKAAAADFARERTVKRYNRQLNDLIGFWAGVLAGDGGELRAFGTGDGVDAVFRLHPHTGFSGRTRP